MEDCPWTCVIGKLGLIGKGHGRDMVKRCENGERPEDAVLGVDDFAVLFGVDAFGFSADVKALIESTDFRYWVLDRQDRDAFILDSLKRLDAGGFTVAGAAKKAVWEEGWQENYDNLVNSGFDLAELVPKYYRPHQVIRLWGELAMSPNPTFEYDFFRVLRLWIFRTFTADCEVLYEFGCGPGHNLVDFVSLYPDKKAHGMDWADVTPKILKALCGKYGFAVEGHVLDMFAPDSSLAVEKEAVMITFGALEQLGNEFGCLLDFLLDRPFMRYIHVEPLVELYDDSSLVDYIAIRHNDARNLLHGYLPRLRDMEEKGIVRISRLQRIRMGSGLEEGWNILVWEKMCDESKREWRSDERCTVEGCPQSTGSAAQGTA